MRYMAILLLGLMAASPAMASAPPDCPECPPDWRGGPLSLHAEWNGLGWSAGPGSFQFLTPDLTWPKDAPPNGEVPNDDSLAYGLFQDNSMLIQLPNWIDREPLKIMRIHLFGDFEIAGDPWWRKWDLLAPTDAVLDGLGVYGSAATNDCVYAYADLHIRPNPDWELIRLADVPADTVINRIVVDTISIPEPSTLTLAGLGTLFIGFFMIRRRRR